MAPQGDFHAGIEKEAQEDLAREAQDRDKSHQRPAARPITTWPKCPQST
jgi:hypothetical protein